MGEKRVFDAPLSGLKKSMDCKLSIVIPCKDENDPNLKELLESIKKQEFPTNQMEVLVISEGTSESAKAIGIRKAKGDVIGFLASDNELTSENALHQLWWQAAVDGAAYTRYYHYSKNDNSLNRYFSLMGCNDPLAFYMKKCDRGPLVMLLNEKYSEFDPKGKTVGDNGFFVKKELIQKTDLDNYYHIDNANEINSKITAINSSFLWHKTGGNIFNFFARRFRYGLQHAFNKNRRWHLVDFSKPQDIRRLAWFVVASISIIPTLMLSIRGWLKIQDKAWFWHPAICLITVFMYSVLTAHIVLRNTYRWLFARMDARTA